jgi:hypothetical protein
MTSIERSVVFQQPSANENREQIIMEATCDEEHLVGDICSKITRIIGGGTIPCWCALCAPIGWCCGQRVAKSWTLQLTNKAVYHTEKHYWYVCSSADTNVRIDVDDIALVNVAKTNVHKWYCVFCSDEYPTTVYLLLKPGRRQDLIPNCCSEDWYLYTVPDPPVLLKFKHCLDAEEFVQKVKQQMQCNAES